MFAPIVRGNAGAGVNAWSPRRRSLAGACLAHFLHDGYTDQLYALLPVWQPQFGLGYAGLAVVRALYFATMGCLQIPADRLAARLSPRVALVAATVVAALGYGLVALPLGFAGLCAGLVVAGIGSSVQHSRASLVVADGYGVTARGPLGLYNFAGDLGKATLPAAVALLLPLMTWRPVVAATALLGLAIAVVLARILPAHTPVAPTDTATAGRRTGSRRGFALLTAIGALDTATRMGYLLFLPFLVHAAGGTERGVGLALALLFAGGALGKACCGWLGGRFGVVACVAFTEAATTALMLATLQLPLVPMLALLPLLGIVLNGTSSVLYGTVPELARGDVGRGFAVFYTGVVGSGGLAPILYGALADHGGRTFGTVAAALTAATVVPIVFVLKPCLVGDERPG